MWKILVVLLIVLGAILSQGCAFDIFRDDPAAQRAWERDVENGVGHAGKWAAARQTARACGWVGLGLTVAGGVLMGVGGVQPSYRSTEAGVAVGIGALVELGAVILFWVAESEDRAAYKHLELWFTEYAPKRMENRSGGRRQKKKDEDRDCGYEVFDLEHEREKARDEERRLLEGCEN